MIVLGQAPVPMTPKPSPHNPRSWKLVIGVKLPTIVRSPDRALFVQGTKANLTPGIPGKTESANPQF
jgi:hypothetical protein